MSISFTARTVGDYWVHNENRWNIELGKHRHKHMFENQAAIGMNLEEGYNNFENEHGNEKLESILAFIIKTARIGTPLKEMIQADFVCRRGLLRNLSINRQCGTFIHFYAVRHRGVIFLWEDKNIGSAPDKLRRAMYFTLKFENVMTTPNARNVTAAKTEETKTVIHATIGKEGSEPIRVYYAAEIDCLDENGQAVEFKTISKPLLSGWDRSRSLAWYMQCFFANARTIVVGERQRSRLRFVHFLDVETIHNRNNHGWQRETCLGQLYSCLEYVKHHMHQDGLALKFTAINGSIYAASTEFGDYIVPYQFLRMFPF